MNSVEPSKDVLGVATSGAKVSTAWAPFTKMLEAVLAQLQEDHFLILAVKRTNLFVQFSHQGAHGVRAEATSNTYLLGPERHSEAKIARLQHLGWKAPTGGQEAGKPEQDPDGSSNFYIDFPPTTPAVQLAELAAATLATVFGAPSPFFIEYEAMDHEGSSIALPALGLKRAVRDPEVRVSEIAERLLGTLREHCGIPSLDFDADGDIGLVRGSCTIYVRLVGSKPHIRFLAPLVAGVQEGEPILRRLNELNVFYGPMHFKFHAGVVIGAYDIPAWPFIAQHVMQSLDEVSELADGLDDFLRAEFGPGAAGMVPGGAYKQ